jgi:hypothetical protein
VIPVAFDRGPRREAAEPVGWDEAPEAGGGPGGAPAAPADEQRSLPLPAHYTPAPEAPVYTVRPAATLPRPAAPARWHQGSILPAQLLLLNPKGAWLTELPS